MRKVLLGLVCLFMLCGCSTATTEKTKKTTGNVLKVWECYPDEKNERLSQIVKVFPEEIYKELLKKGYYTVSEKQKDGSYIKSFANAKVTANTKKDPTTLRLDFEYDSNGTLNAFYNKEYGFINDLEEQSKSKASFDMAKRIAKNFAAVFLKKEVKLTKTTPVSGYEDSNYITFKDQSNFIYLIALKSKTILRYAQA